MVYEDLEEVCALENLCFTTPWTVTSFQYEITNNDALLKVAVADNVIAGFICIRSMLDITHILDIAVEPGKRRRGIGSRLLQNSIDALKKLRPDIKHITLEVRESNHEAISLYERSGFKKTGIRRNYFRNPPEDGIIMGLDLD